ncbi:alpha/beta fold hydrolase [Alloalcanivorax mobilis]|uniref:alpha/beta fold hydrolase n=1 Tax=Alloalcanivorax mobilis TaxID=2019569 RepID=UPI000C794A67|nr:alpha/beta hydrolase [Alloalcanivorax mobilis]
MRALILLATLAVALAMPLSGSADEPAFDARLEGYQYPYTVHTLKLNSQRQDLEMAFMDVKPAQPNGRAVLLLHGKNFSGAYWGDTIAALSDEGYRVVVPDQIGFGKSSKPAHFQYSFQTLADHTRVLLDTLGVRKVNVVGHSMGGMLATRFALMFPERSESLSLVNPIGLEDWKRVVPWQPVEAWYQAELKKTPQQVKRYMTASYFDGQWKSAYQPLLTLQQGWIRGPDYSRVAWNSALAYDMIFNQPVVHEFQDIKVPTLLIIGTRDRTALGKNRAPQAAREQLGRYDQLGQRAAELIPNARLVELPGVGHVPQYEAFKPYMRALGGYLDSVGPQA